MSPGTAVVLLDYDQAATTRRCLRSMASGDRLPQHVVLVENGATSVDLESDKEVADLDVEILRPGRNVGAAAGRNLAMRHLIERSDAERFVFLDNDTVVPPDFFRRVAELEVGRLEVLAPLVLDMDSGEVIYAGGDYDRHHIPHVIGSWPSGLADRREVDWAPTAALLVTREAWLRVGGFDAWYEFLWEDVEWCHRAIGAGAVIRVEPQLRVLHEAHQSTGGAFSAERVRRWSRNGTVFLFDNVRVGWADGLAWFWLEIRRVVRELRAGWRHTARGRLQGLGQGISEVLRRRLARRRPTSFDRRPA